MANVHRNTPAERPWSTVVQERLGKVARIVSAAADLLKGDTGRAIVWFRHQPIPGFDGRTAEEMVAEGQGGAALSHLDDLRDGGYA